MTVSHEIEVYVRVCETDAAGHVNNASYFLYLEEARTKFFHELGIGIEADKPALNFILASTKCDYLAQAFAMRKLKVSTHVASIGTKSFTLDHVITETDTDVVVAKASATLVYFDYHKQETEAIPNLMRDQLELNLVR